MSTLARINGSRHQVNQGTSGAAAQKAGLPKKMIWSGSLGNSTQAKAAAAPRSAVPIKACSSARVFWVSAALRTILGNITAAIGRRKVIRARPISAAGIYPVSVWFTGKALRT